MSRAQVEMTSRQLDVLAQSSEARSGLEVRPCTVWGGEEAWRG